ncbi:MAG: hypothetical protein JSW43_03535 [Gemmatimonadota bacterium]|nr:MAG: hypothetical protein JSW43_03535 [Gemmatimonadota bacterium]
MSDGLLNANQRRHVATHVHLLLDDLAQLGQLAELGGSEESARRVRHALSRAEVAAQEMMAQLDLPPSRARGARQHVVAAANVWATRIYELNAKRLAAYGPVHEELANRLDRLVSDLRHRLVELGEAALELPEA